jgi:hypothetical protein
MALGAALQRIRPVTSFSIIAVFSLYVLAGRIGVLAFESTWLLNIAANSPLT